jgi:hypothetical protein
MPYYRNIGIKLQASLGRKSGYQLIVAVNAVSATDYILWYHGIDLARHY